MKAFFLLTCSFFLFNISFGQTQFGLKAGVNLANVSFGSPNNNKSRIGFYVGGVSQFDINKTFLIRPELLYSIKGYRSSATQFSGEATASLNYIALPILFGYKPTEQLVILAGPELGFLTGAKSKFDGRTNDLSSIYKKFDLGIDLGLSYNFSNSFAIDLRYNYGLKKLIDVVYTDQYGSITGSGKTGANRVIQLGFIYLFSK